MNREESQVFKIKVGNLISWGISLGSLLFLFGQAKAKLEAEVQRHEIVIERMRSAVAATDVFRYRIEDLARRVEKLEGR